MTRQSRIKRRTDVAINLTDRDKSLLRALARLRIARTSQILELLFRGVRRDTASERLRRLFDVGLLDVRSGERSEENLYSLGPAGRTWLRERGHEAGGVPRGGLEHHLAIVQAWVRLAAATHVSSALSLQIFRADWEIREELGSSEPLLVPDAVVQLGSRHGQGGPLRFALEVDRRTERPPELRRKVQLYEQLRAGPDGIFGWTDVGLLVALQNSGSRRETALKEILGDEWGGWSLLWAEEKPASELLEELAGLPSRTPLAVRGVIPLKLTKEQGGRT